MVRIIKKGNVAYFSLAGIPMKWENKAVGKLDVSDPYYNILMSYEQLKDQITETEDSINLGDVAFNKNEETFVDANGENVNDEITEQEEDAVTFMLESEETEGDEKSITIKNDDEESIISLQEEEEVDAEEDIDAETDDEEVDKEESISVSVDDKSALDEDSEEIELIISKLEDINSNVSKLEDADLEQDIDLQKAYLEELGKKHLLEERLAELNYVDKDRKETIVSKILESNSYIDLRKKPEAVKLLESKKMGNKVNQHILKEARKRLIESIKKSGKLKESGVTVDYHEQDGNFIFSGDLSKYTEDQILLVPEEDFFNVFDTIIKGIELSNPSTLFEEEEIEDKTFDVKPVSAQKIQEALEELEEELEATELKDGEYYTTICNLYKDQEDKISEEVSVGCTLYCPENYIVQYSKEDNCMVSEDGVTFNIPAEYLKPSGEIVKPNDLVENETYTAVDDFGKSADVTFEGVDETSSLLEFKTKLKESFYIDKKILHQYIRFKN